MINLNFGIGGEFRGKLYNADGSLELDTGWFTNEIVNNGLLIYTTTPQVFTYMCIGSSSAPTGPSDTTIKVQNPGGVATGGTYTSIKPTSSPWVVSETVTRTFNAGDGTGTVAEVTMGATNTGGNIFSRAVIPAPFTKDPAQILKMSYRLTLTLPEVDVVANGIEIDGVSYNTTTRGLNYQANFASPSILTQMLPDTASAANFNCYDGDLGALNAATPQGTNGLAYKDGVNVYLQGASDTVGHMEFAVTMPIDYGNATGGCRTMMVSITAADCRIQTEFRAVSGDGPVPKDETNVFTPQFRVQWART